MKLEDIAIPTIEKLKVARKKVRETLSQGITENELNALMNVLIKLERNVYNELKNIRKKKKLEGDSS